MRDVLRHLIRRPGSEDQLELVVLQDSRSGDGSQDVRDGILFHAGTRKAYPVIDGVPIMLDDAFPEEFIARHRVAMAGHSGLSAASITAGRGQDWSFSREWEEHFTTESDRTWGYSVQERVEQFLLETQTTEASLTGMLVLDAGCGNGALSEAISELGAVVVGMDYSSSVRSAERHRRSGRVHFLQGDLQAPPFPEGSFDLAISIGVLHHTPDTLSTFRAVARLVKPGGKFYMWLYRRPEGVVGRYLKVPVYDLLRFFIARFPAGPQRAAVTSYARLVRVTHNLRDSRNPIPLREYVVSAYDDLTPRWHHYHTPLEVSRWFHAFGYSAPTISHWDNPYGFGLVATRQAQAATPGIHYGSGVKLWDHSRTLLGRLHAD